MKGCTIVRSAARGVYLSPAGLVAPTFRQISKKTIFGRDWRLDLKFLLLILLVTSMAGLAAAYQSEIIGKISAPVTSGYDRLVAAAEHLANNSDHLNHDLDIDNSLTAQGLNR
jgi:hypothetical protein